MDQTSNNKRIAKNTMMLYIRMLLSMVVSLYTSRVVLEVLGVEDYGIYGVVGGVVCRNCEFATMEERTKKLSLEVMAGLKALQNMSWQRLSCIAFSSDAKQQLDNYLELQLDSILERPLKTKNFIRQML